MNLKAEMLENTGDSTKRQPSSRIRGLNRRHSRDRFDRISSLASDNGERDGGFSNSNAPFDRGGFSGTNNSASNNKESLITGLVSINGFTNSEAVKLMNERWAAAMHSHNDLSLDETERPVIYSSSGGSVWGSSKLAYQPSVMDFLADMGQAIRKANINQANMNILPK